MKRQGFVKAGLAASALPVALALALIPPGASAQEKKIVPFLTAESSPEAVKQILDLIAAFEEENPDIGIELQLMSNDIRAARIINSAAVGDELGIFEIERRLVPDFTQAGYLLPLDSIVESIGEDKFIPGSLLYWPFDGHLYQFTSDLSAGTLYWREDLFEEAGLAEPDSYERLLEASERLNGQNGVSGNAFEASHLEDFEFEKLRFSFLGGIRSPNHRDHSFNLLLGFGTNTFEQGGEPTTIRFLFGGTTGF